MIFEAGQKIRMRGESIPGWVTVDFASPTDDGWKLYIKDALSVLHALELSNLEAQYVVNRPGFCAVFFL